tara:strand:+ start:157 stop:1590 length:1434 start_codon:yes stop_codon:yes gene_type:complete
MATTANSSSWVRTYTKDDATKYQIAYRSNNAWKEDANGRALPGSFTTNLQVDRTAIDGDVTGGGVSATWTTAATRGPGANGVWERKYLDDDDTTLGYALPDASWDDLNSRTSNFNAQVNNISSNAIVKYFRTLGFGRGSGLSTQAGAIRELARSQGINDQGNPSDESTGANQSLRTLADDARDRPREKYQSRYTYYYPVALKANRDQDKIQISVLEYKPRPINKGQGSNKTTLGIGEREGYTSRTLGSVFLPVPGNVLDNNNVSWSEDTMDPLKLAAANAFFENVQKGSGAIDGIIEAAEGAAKAVGQNSGDIKTSIAAALAKSATGGNILTRKTGQIINPNMELLFKSPMLRTFSLAWKMSPRDYEESEMIKKIIRMFKQSQAVKRSESMVFLKSPNTYKLRYLTARGREHGFLPKIKECALTGCSINYTPDGNYQTYENSSMVAYQMTLNFNELEPIYHDDYYKLDQDRDESVGF